MEYLLRCWYFWPHPCSCHMLSPNYKTAPERQARINKSLTYTYTHSYTQTHIHTVISHLLELCTVSKRRCWRCEVPAVGASVCAWDQVHMFLQKMEREGIAYCLFLQHPRAFGDTAKIHHNMARSYYRFFSK